VASSEYFLVSNRQQTGFDDHLPGEGCVVEHVDDTRTSNTDETHYLVDIVQCDGRQDLNKNANRGDATDPYPCSANGSLTASTTPSSRAYDGSDSNVAVTNITRAGDDITADINVGGVFGQAVGLRQGGAGHLRLPHHPVGLGLPPGRRLAADQGLGPRRRHNLFDMCCQAVANGQNVHADVDGDFIYTMYLV
jgi:immune inhibitor A